MPVQSAHSRLAKFDAKLDANIIADRIEARRANMVARAASAAADLVALDSAVRGLLNNSTDPRNRLIYYMSFARELHKKHQSLAGNAFNTEAQILAAKWKNRGLNEDLLNSIIGLFQG